MCFSRNNSFIFWMGKTCSQKDIHLFLYVLRVECRQNNKAKKKTEKRKLKLGISTETFCRWTLRKYKLPKTHRIFSSFALFLYFRWLYVCVCVVVVVYDEELLEIAVLEKGIIFYCWYVLALEMPNWKIIANETGNVTRLLSFVE